MFDEVYASFLADDDPHLGKDDWRWLFTLSPHQDEDYCGYALLDGGKIVGMLGMIFSKRSINGNVTRFCNLHSWFVKDAHRGHSLRLMRPALRLTGHTLTDFTPTNRVCTISKKLGFKQLDSRLKILFPFHFPTGKCDVELIEDTNIIASRLNEADVRLMEDHKRDTFGHLMVQVDDVYCYMICNRVERHVMPYCHVHYISNKQLFARYETAIRQRLIRMSRSRFVAIDARMVAGARLRPSITVPLSSQQLYRPADLQPEEIDSLYSEVSLLRLATFPNLSHSLGQWSQRLRSIWSSCGKSINVAGIV